MTPIPPLYSNTPEKDPMGNAMLEYLDGTADDDILVYSDIAEDDVMPVAYLFRDFANMHKVEQVALKTCKGKVLDAGAGAGSHALWLQENGLDVKAIDTSPGAVACMKRRGIKDVELANYFTYDVQKFDTILFMMNGVGIAGDLIGLKAFLEQGKRLLNKGGQIILDSSDLIYLFPEGTGEYTFPDTYYGIVSHQMHYKHAMTEWFQWLFVDPATLRKYAAEVGFEMDIIAEGPMHDFSVRLY